MKILEVAANNRKKAFEVRTREGEYTFPYARLDTPPTPENRVADVFVDRELGSEAFTYRLASGDEDSVHVDQVLDYNGDPAYLTELFTYRLTLEAEKAVEESGLSKREIIRRLGTSASQFYRLLDPTNSRKSIGQLLTLLHILGYDVGFTLRGMDTNQSKARRVAASSTGRSCALGDSC